MERMIESTADDAILFAGASAADDTPDSPPSGTVASPEDEAASRAMGAHLRVSASDLIRGKLDARSLGFALALGVVFFLLGILCLAVSRFDAILASVWLPNAGAVALLLLARPRNELPAIIAIGLASLAANSVSGTPMGAAAIFTLGNIASILLTTWLTRRSCGELPDLTDLAHLGRFLQYGGIIGPLASAIVVLPAMGTDPASLWAGGVAWFLAESMGMMLVVPGCLLVAAALRDPAMRPPAKMLEFVAMNVAGLCAVFFIFNQTLSPLLFLAPPVTLFIALRLGALGTAVFVPGIAVIASVMTFNGLGPIVLNVYDDLHHINLIQAFVAANFLTGLPVAAILAGRERMTDELIRGREELALLTEGITDAVLLIDNEGICAYASPSVIDVLGRSPEDFVGRRVTDRTHEDARDRIAGVLTRMLSGESDNERLTYRRLLDDENGNPVFIEAECAIVEDTETGERSGIVVSARDVTERVELELLLTRARRSAERAASAKTEFLANMSHEIRTPMNGVLGFAELLREGDLSEDHRRHADMIVQSGRSMMMLLNDILDLTKIEAGQIGIASEAVDLFGTIAECAALYRPNAEKKGLAFELTTADFPDDLPLAESGDGGPWIRTDGLRLRQIILNLVGNAIKFTENGGVVIHVAADAEEIAIDVIDSGIGISEQRLQSIFAPFTQGEGDTARRYGGTGLGLSISRQLAELLGGTITVISKAGKGSTFRLTLPATYTEPAPLEVSDDEPVDPGALPQAASILLVEDHDVNRMLVTEMLERCGQSVAIAHDGNEAIAMVIDSVMRGSPFDLVLMDIQMPGCDGYAATRAIRAEGLTAETMPIVALTANAFPEDIAAAREAGMQAHLAKPLVFADLARVLQRWLPTRIIEHGSDTDEKRSEHVSDEREKGQAQDRGDEADEKASGLLEAEIIDISRDRHARPPKIGDATYGQRAADGRHGPRPAQTHSPELMSRWNARRSEAIEAVRIALEGGALGEKDGVDETCDELARLVHKLAGTAAIFGEPELGDQAAAFEHALRMRLPADVRESLAFELLSVADDPADTLASAGG